MTQYEVDISITDTGTDKEVLRITVTRETLHTALTAAAAGAHTVIDSLSAPPNALVIPPAVRREEAYCLTHDMVWNAKGHDAQMWCNTRRATSEEIATADLSVEEREFTTEPVEIEQMEQRVVGIDPATTPDGKSTIVEGLVEGGVLHIGMPRGTDPNTITDSVTTFATQSLSEGQDRIYGPGH